MNTPNPLGVVVVLFNSSDVIEECLEGLFASQDVSLKVVLVNNNSSDNTCEIVRNWATGASQFSVAKDSPIFDRHVPVKKPVPLMEKAEGSSETFTNQLLLLHSPFNGGFAYAVNLGLKELLKIPEVNLFWILNPDSVPAPDAAKLFLARGKGREFSLMGGPTVYYKFPDLLQSYGGRVGRWSGTCRNIGRGQSVSGVEAPDPGTVDYISGANMIASRRFIEKGGLLTEDYYLFYEEVDWAFRRGDLPLIIVPETRVYHHGGSATGSGSTVRRPSPFTNYFNYRNRIVFARRHLRVWIGYVYLYALTKAAVLAMKGALDESWAIVCGVFRLRPAAAIVSRLSDPEARHRAFLMRFPSVERS